VLADEPTGNLDPESAQEALGLIRSLCQESGAALLLVSHDPSILQGFEPVQDFAELNQAGGLVR
jgi:ABC-type lipoprotein export system ATPase subunit